MADDRLFRVLVLGGMALISAAPAAAAVSITGCALSNPPREGPPPPREGPPPYVEEVDASSALSPPHPVETAAPSAAAPSATAPLPPPTLDAGTDGGFRLRPPREGPPPRPKQGL